MEIVSSTHWAEVIRTHRGRKYFCRVTCTRCGFINSIPVPENHQPSKQTYLDAGWHFAEQRILCSSCNRLDKAESIRNAKILPSLQQPVPPPIHPTRPNRDATIIPLCSFLQTCWECATDAERDQLIETVFAWADARTSPKNAPAPSPKPPAQTLAPNPIIDPILAKWRKMQSS